MWWGGWVGGGGVGVVSEGGLVVVCVLVESWVLSGRAGGWGGNGGLGVGVSIVGKVQVPYPINGGTKFSL